MNPTRVADLTPAALRARLHGAGLYLRSGPLTLAIRSREAAICESIGVLYPDHILAAEDFADFHVEVRRAPGLRGWLKPQVVFELDGQSPFQPLPRTQSFAMLEWGLNWCVATHCHQYLIIHAAVIERDGLAAILPAPPGSGKSTLTAALIQRGWRLCSDELTLLRPEDGRVVPLARPVNLKNSSIEVLKRFAPEVVFGPEVHDTLKGRVAHLRPAADDVQRSGQCAHPRWIVFPRWQAGIPAQMEARPKAQAFLQLAENAFNYSMLGERGFNTLGDTIERCDCLSFSYSELDDAVRVFDALVQAAR